MPRIHVNPILPCNRIVGYLAAYRVCMAVATFFFMLAIIMICVKSSRDPRSYIQNGFWLFKWLLVIGLATAFFFIPDGQNFVFSKSESIMLLSKLNYVPLETPILDRSQSTAQRRNKLWSKVFIDLTLGGGFFFFSQKIMVFYCMETFNN